MSQCKPWNTPTGTNNNWVAVDSPISSATRNVGKSAGGMWGNHAGKR